MSRGRLLPPWAMGNSTAETRSVPSALDERHIGGDESAPDSFSQFVGETGCAAPPVAPNK
jgi:hypothetical protein